MQPRDIDRSFPTYNIPSGQLWWVSRAKSLGYPSNQKGACYGMSLIVMQAMLLSLEEMLIYNARLQLIANMSIQDLIKMHKYAWYSAARKKRGDILAAYDLNIFMLENPEATAKQIAEEQEKIEAYREIENEFVEKNIINNPEAIQTFLAEKIALYLEIIALFDGVELAQQLPEVPLSEADHQNIFGTHKIDSQLIAVSANLTVSDELKKQGSLTEVDLIAWNKNGKF